MSTTGETPRTTSRREPCCKPRKRLLDRSKRQTPCRQRSRRSRTDGGERACCARPRGRRGGIGGHSVFGKQIAVRCRQRPYRLDRIGIRTRGHWSHTLQGSRGRHLNRVGFGRQPPKMTSLSPGRPKRSGLLLCPTRGGEVTAPWKESS
jgi:hypothetical protein